MAQHVLTHDVEELAVAQRAGRIGPEEPPKKGRPLPNDEAAMKLLYLALRNAEKKWLAPHRDWKRMYAQLVIYFGDRIPT